MDGKVCVDNKEEAQAHSTKEGRATRLGQFQNQLKIHTQPAFTEHIPAWLSAQRVSKWHSAYSSHRLVSGHGHPIFQGGLGGVKKCAGGGGDVTQVLRDRRTQVCLLQSHWVRLPPLRLQSRL